MCSGGLLLRSSLVVPAHAHASVQALIAPLSLPPCSLTSLSRVAVARPLRTDFAVFNHRGPMLGALPHMRNLTVPEIR